MFIQLGKGNQKLNGVRKISNRILQDQQKVDKMEKPTKTQPVILSHQEEVQFIGKNPSQCQDSTAYFPYFLQLKHDDPKS